MYISSWGLGIVSEVGRLRVRAFGRDIVFSKERGWDRFSASDEMVKEPGRDRFSTTDEIERERGQDRFSATDDTAMA